MPKRLTVKIEKVVYAYITNRIKEEVKKEQKHEEEKQGKMRDKSYGNVSVITKW